jgi:type I restriction enzyme S subunit
MTSWQITRLGDILEFQRGFDITQAEQQPGTVPIISSSGISSYHNEAKAKGPGVVIGRKGTLGKVYYVQSEYWPHDTTLWVKDFKGNDPVYIYYLLKTLHFENFDVGAANPTLNRNHLHKLNVRHPSADIQRKIAAILLAHDELIANNNSCIAFLEKMAEALYQEWFVRLRFPGHTRTKNHHGIPDGWSLKPFSSVVQINPVERVDNGAAIPYVAMDDLSTTSMLFSIGEYRMEKSGAKFRNLDTLFPRITPSLENGKRGLVLSLEPNQVAVGSTEFIVFRAGELSAEQIYFLSCAPDFRKHAELSMVGASGRQRVHMDCFDSFLVLVPSRAIREMFSGIIRPFIDEAKALYQQNANLRHTRDMLLSRLLSGKLDVENLDIRFPPGLSERE